MLFEILRSDFLRYSEVAHEEALSEQCRKAGCCIVSASVSGKQQVNGSPRTVTAAFGLKVESTCLEGARGLLSHGPFLN